MWALISFTALQAFSSFLAMHLYECIVPYISLHRGQFWARSTSSFNFSWWGWTQLSHQMTPTAWTDLVSIPEVLVTRFTVTQNLLLSFLAVVITNTSDHCTYPWMEPGGMAVPCWSMISHGTNIIKSSCSARHSLCVKYRIRIFYTVSQKKNDNDVAGYIFNAHQSILIVFGR